jgi:glycosyltransferase involved in cell wall biosynthesis
MRVLQVLKTSNGAKWALRQMGELAKLGVEVHVALPPGGQYYSSYSAAGVTVHPLNQPDLPIKHPNRIPDTLRAFRDLVSEVRPDAIHSHFVGTTLTMRLALGKDHPIPRAFQIPGPLHLEHPFFRRAEKMTAGKADYWIGSCRWTCDCYRSMGVPEDRIFLSYYGLDLDDFPPMEPGAMRRELKIAPESKVIGMVALMYPPKRYLGHRRGIKGHEDLIDALALCVDRGHDVVGVFVGGASIPGHPYEAAVRRYGSERLGDRAVFLGTRNDVARLYPDFDIAVHPSHSENVGGAGESLLLAAPTIATNVGGLPDAVIPNQTGWLAPPRDPEALAQAIADALENPERAHQMARAGQQLMREMVDVRRNALEVLSAYEAILAHSGSRR